MLRFLARLIGGFLLAVAVVFAVGDIARSLTGDRLQLTPLGEALAYLGIPAAPDAGGSQFVHDLTAMAVVWPASVALAVLALVLLFIGRPRRRREQRRIAR